MLREVETFFLPLRRMGLLVHGGLAIILGGASGVLFWLALQTRIGSTFVLFLLASLLLLPPLVMVLYRGYALLRAGYLLERDGLRLRWGLRSEDIPLDQIEWVRPATEAGYDLPRPFLAIPGAFLGVRTVEGLGAVEFMASDWATLVLVATPARIFAISPADNKRFLTSFQRTIEMGSLSPLPAQTARPAAFLRQVWDDRLAKILLTGSMALVLVLFVLVSLTIPGRSEVALGFRPNGQPGEPVPAAMLLLLPVLAALVYAGDLLTGLFSYRRGGRDGHYVAYLLWLGSGLTAALLITAAIILT